MIVDQRGLENDAGILMPRLSRGWPRSALWTLSQISETKSLGVNYSGILDTMLRGNWRFIVTVVGCLIAAGVLSWVLSPERPELTSNAGYQGQAPDYRAGGYNCQPAIVRALPGRERLSRAKACEEAEEEHRLKADDLIQQRRSADAANAMARLSFEQTRIAALGVALGFITMAAAIAAAFYAKGASDGAHTANQIARRIDERGRQPKIEISLGQHQPIHWAGDLTGTLLVKPVNLGKLDACDILFAVRLVAFQGEVPRYPISIFDHLEPVVEFDRLPIVDGGNESELTFERAVWVTANDIPEGDFSVCAFIAARYSWGQSRTTTDTIWQVKFSQMAGNRPHVIRQGENVMTPEIAYRLYAHEHTANDDNRKHS